MPKLEITDIKINPSDPRYFYVFKSQIFPENTKIKNYVASEGKDTNVLLL